MIRVAIIGAGLMGRWHLAAARRAGARVVGVVDSDLAAAQRLARQAPGADAAADPARLFSTAGLQAVHVCTPAQTHLALTAAALEAGVSALVEKPLAADAAETAALLALAAARGLQLCPVHQYAFQPAMDAACARLAEIGPLRRVDFDICSAGATGGFSGRPDAVVEEILPHPLSMLQRLVPGGSLEAVDWSVLHPAAGEMLATGRLEETLVSLSISLNARPTRFVMRAQGDGGTVTLDGFHGFAIIQRGAVSRLAKIMGPFGSGARQLAGASANLAGRVARWEPAYPGLRSLVRRFYAAVAGASAPISPADVLAGAHARDAIIGRMSLEAAHD